MLRQLRHACHDSSTDVHGSTGDANPTDSTCTNPSSATRIDSTCTTNSSASHACSTCTSANSSAGASCSGSTDSADRVNSSDGAERSDHAYNYAKRYGAIVRVLRQGSLAGDPN